MKLTRKTLLILMIFVATQLISSSVSASIHLPPSKVSGPSDLTYVEGTTGHSLEWIYNAHESQDNPTVYFVMIDDTVLEDHNGESWVDNEAIEVNVDGLSIGEHTLEIEVQDNGFPDQAAAATDSVKVTVIAEGEELPSTSSSDDASVLSGVAVLSLFTITLLSVVLKRKNS